MIRYERCPICDSAGIHRAITAQDHTVSGEIFDILQCAQCSLRFTQDIPSAGEIGRYYKSHTYISHTETSKGIVNWLYLRIRKFTLSIKRDLIEDITGLKKGNLLDVGAGTGAFLHHMKEHGWITDGVEPDNDAISLAAKRYDLSLKPSSALFTLPEKYFDAITLWHVLEHVHDLNAYITQLKKLCKPGGKIFIAVPNYTSLDAEHYSSYWAAYDVPRHLYHFSPASMQHLMNSHGCVIEKMQPMWFDSFYVSLLSEKYKSGKTKLFSGFLTGLRSNSKAWSNSRKASSIIYVISPDSLPA
jgi:SAM-dependent methyltransferase